MVLNDVIEKEVKRKKKKGNEKKKSARKGLTNHGAVCVDEMMRRSGDHFLITPSQDGEDIVHGRGDGDEDEDER